MNKLVYNIAFNKIASSLSKIAFGDKEHTLLSTGSVSPTGVPKKSVAKSLGYSARDIAEAARSVDKGVTHPFNPIGFNTMHSGAGSVRAHQGRTIRALHEGAVKDYARGMEAHLLGRDATPFYSRATSMLGGDMHMLADLKHHDGPLQENYATRLRGILPGYVASGLEHVKSDHASPTGSNTSLGILKRKVMDAFKSQPSSEAQQALGTNAIDQLTGTRADKSAVRRSEALLRTTKKKAIREIIQKGYTPQQAEEAWNALQSINIPSSAKRSAKLRTILKVLRSK